MTSGITPKAFAVCTAVSLFCGLILSLSHMFRNPSSKSFAVTTALLPVIVQVIIMLVNGNLGTGIAVAGAFSLVRFRSAPGSAREILSIFTAMAAGLATGVGYIGIAVIFTVILCLAVTDSSGRVIASFMPSKQYSNIVVSSAGLTVGGSYTVTLGGTVSDCDQNGFSCNGKVTGGEKSFSVEISSVSTVYGSSCGMGGQPDRGMGGGKPGGMMR